MARITVEECLTKVDNRFDLVLLAARRARQLAGGNKNPLIDNVDDKPTVVALREIEAGFITKDKMDASERAEEAERQALQRSAALGPAPHHQADMDDDLD